MEFKSPEETDIAAALARFEEGLVTEGFSQERAQNCASIGPAARLYFTKPLSLVAEIERSRTELVAESLPDYLRLLQRPDTDEDPASVHRAIRAKLDEFFNTPYRLNSSSVAQTLLRYKELILLWTDASQFRNFILSFLKENIDKNTLGPTGSTSLFLALHYRELQLMFPQDEELFTLMNTVIKAYHRGPALHALTPKRFLPEDDLVGIRPYTQEDDVLESDAIRPLMRVDTRYTDCDLAEVYHAQTSLSGEVRDNNVFVFVKNHLVGSLKTGEDEIGVQKTFLGMRTVHRPATGQLGGRFDDTHPVVEGGFYLLTNETIDAARRSQERGSDQLHLDSLSLMPLRSIHKFGLNAAEDERYYLDAIRRRRKEVEG